MSEDAELVARLLLALAEPGDEVGFDRLRPAFYRRARDGGGDAEQRFTAALAEWERAGALARWLNPRDHSIYAGFDRSRLAARLAPPGPLSRPSALA